MSFIAGPPLAADVGGAGLRVHLVLTVAAGLALTGWLGRRRLPTGMGVGLVIAALGSAALVIGVTDLEEITARARLGHILAAMAIVSYAASRVAGRRAAVPQRVALLAATVCGLGAAANALAPWADGTSRSVGTLIDPLALLILAAAAWARHRGPWATYAWCGAAGGALASWLGIQWTGIHRNVGVTATMLAVAIAGLLCALATVLAHWSHRRRVAIEAPQRLTETYPQHTRILRLVVAGGGLVALGGVLLPTAAGTPVALAIAAVAVLTVGHRQRSGATGEFGLVLLGLSIVTGGSAWVAGGWDGALLGCALAGVYFRWLAGFWEQQLLDGRPWTTAGRLIPVARRLACVAAFAGFGLAAGATLCAAPSAGAALWRAGLTVVLCLALASGLVRDADLRGGVAAACGAVLVTVAAAAPARQLATVLAGVNLAPVTLVAAAGLLLGMRVAARPIRGSGAPLLNACIGGVVPVIAFVALPAVGADAQMIVATALAAGAGLLTLVRGCAAGLTAAGPAPDPSSIG